MHLFSIRDVDYHTSLKRNLASLYTKSAVQQLEPRIDKCTGLFVEQLDRISTHRPAQVNMSLWPHLFAFDSLAEMNVSKNFGFLESGTDVRGLIAIADKIMHITALVKHNENL